MTMTDTGRDAVTATVEVLTAEVRTLVVGNRQITQSVYRQLDAVEPEHIQPFGRVHEAKALGQLHVVGRSRLDGTLVRSAMTSGYGREHFVTDVVPDELGVVFRLHEQGESYTLWPPVGHIVVVGQRGAMKVGWLARAGYAESGKRYVNDPHMGDHEVGWISDEMGRAARPFIDPVLDEMTEARDLRVAWEQLPLIVLAGLR